jgi:hypothetical protein
MNAIPTWFFKFDIANLALCFFSLHRRMSFWELLRRRRASVISLVYGICIWGYGEWGGEGGGVKGDRTN